MSEISTLIARFEVVASNIYGKAVIVSGRAITTLMLKKIEIE